ncbi:MAG: SLC13/DASS family transporter [Myxococcales bacterium]|nr:SLC13/DASS family transporter [Myxococcales bacterium]
MPLPGADIAKEWVPVVLRLPWRTPPGISLAILAFVAANEGWLAGPLGLTRPAEVTLGIVLVAAILWITEAVPLFVTSLLVLALELTWLAPTLSEGRGPALFVNAFFSDVTLLFLGGFVLSAGLERTALDRRLARGILRRAGRTPTRVLLATMVTTALLSMWMSNTAACALMLGLAGSMLAKVPEGDGFRKALLLGIAFSANLGGIATPIGSPPNAIMLRYLQAEGNAPSFGAWMMLAGPLLIALLVVVLAYLARRFPTQVEEVELDEDDDVRPFRGPQALVVGVLLLTITGWLMGDRLGLTPGTVALLPVVLFFGSNLLRVPELRALPWDVLLLIGGGLALGAAIDQSGLASWASARLPTEGLPELALVGVVALLAAALSAVMSNTAAANLLAPMIMGLSGVSAAPLLVVAALACSLAMPLPVSTPPNAMAFGFGMKADGRGELVARDMIVPGTTLTLVGLAALALFAAFWFPTFGL